MYDVLANYNYLYVTELLVQMKNWWYLLARIIKQNASSNPLLIMKLLTFLIPFPSIKQTHLIEHILTQNLSITLHLKSCLLYEDATHLLTL